MQAIGALRSAGGSFRRALPGRVSGGTPSPRISLARRAFSASTSRSDPSAASSNPPAKKKVNPYRLPPLKTFLGSFAPLHAAGWRLDSIPAEKALGTTSHSAATDMVSGVDLQNRRMTRAYAFPANREGWRALTALLARVGEAVEAEDHHPTITVAPFSDLPSSIREIVNDDGAGYVLSISTHTHTPLPPLGAEGANFEGTPRPGVTYKDLRLAERLEAIVAEA